MKKGDLVRVIWRGFRDSHEGLGQVVQYDPDWHGGTQCYSSRSWSGWEPGITTEPIRGRVLVRLYADGGLSWWDEHSVQSLEEDEVSPVREGTDEI